MGAVNGLLPMTWRFCAVPDEICRIAMDSWEILDGAYVRLIEGRWWSQELVNDLPATRK